MFRLHWRWLCVVAVLGSVSPVAAQESLRPDLKKLAEVVSAVVKKEGQGSVSLGSFTGRGGPTSAGAGIKKVLGEELAAKEIAISDKASLEVSGRYIPRGDRTKDFQGSTEVVGLLITVTVTDAEGTPLAIIDKEFNGDGGQIKHLVEDRYVVAQVLGVTQPDEGGNRTQERQGRDLKKRIDQPSVTISGSRIKAGPEGQYAIEVQVRRGGKYVPLAAIDEQGFAFNRLEETDVFALNLINESDYEAAVEVTIDGLSNFAFYEKKGYRHMIVPPRSSYLMKGWQRNAKISDEFIITDYAKGAVKELGASPDGVGTITVAFAAAWDPRWDPNDPERSKLARRPPDDQSQSRGINDPAAGRGRPIASPVVDLPREIGRVRDIISVRYKKPEMK